MPQIALAALPALLEGGGAAAAAGGAEAAAGAGAAAGGAEAAGMGSRAMGMLSKVPLGGGSKSGGSKPAFQAASGGDVFAGGDFEAPRG